MRAYSLHAHIIAFFLKIFSNIQNHPALKSADKSYEVKCSFNVYLQEKIKLIIINETIKTIFK
jgi:hypothetical protein